MFPPDLAKTIVVPVFAGQGSGTATLDQARICAIHDAESMTGSLLLSSCFDAFLAEISALSRTELDQSGISPADFKTPGSLLAPKSKYSRNPIVSGASLFLYQVLRYQSHVQPTPGSQRSFCDVLTTNADHGVGVLGLSSGIFPACVVAASYNPLSYISIAVEVFRLVFWMGFRTLQFAKRVLAENPAEPSLPWSIVCLGLSETDIRKHIQKFQEEHHSSHISVTAIFGSRCVTVSGHPSCLHRFSNSISQICTVHETTVNALYHSRLHIQSTRQQVIGDLERRGIRFPDFCDLRCPIRSTISGTLAESSSECPSLSHLVIDMILVHPVKWDLISEQISFALPPSFEIFVLNVGPSSGAVRPLEEALSAREFTCHDITFDLEAMPPVSAPKHVPIAIVGMAIRAPGASDANELWKILERGNNTISKLPEDRFPVSSSVDTAAHPMVVGTGNFIHGYDEFDHQFFKISPREAKSMDPQQRILLHTAYEALENAGYVPDATPSFQRETFGCYIGAATQDYAEHLRNDIDIHYCTGTLRAFLSGRISYFMHFGGPSVVIDTACSSSLTAIYHACRALSSGDCNAAIAGGVNIISSPDMFVGLERGHFLNQFGQCRSFDASADGYSRGEGCGLFVLKRLSDAIAENDNIIGVIRGVEVNQSGLARSITHPHSPTLTNLLTKLLRTSAVQASRISVVEAHGTGTQAGDSSELESVRSVFAKGRPHNNPLHISSLKANIGHLEAASGAASLCKLLLMLRHNIIPAQISLRMLNPRIAPLEIDNTIINTLPLAWESGPLPRIAVLNNSGASGSNSALLLEEYIKPQRAPHAFTSFVFGISAKTESALENLRSRYIQWFRDTQNHQVPLCDIAYTATARRQMYPFRLAMTVGSKEELVRCLGSTPITQVDRPAGQVVFVFSGQGGQYLGMGLSLYRTSPTFRDYVDGCHAYLVSLGYPGVLPVIEPNSVTRHLTQEEQIEAIQCAVVVYEVALANLWKHWGISPSAVIGHSLGEYAAMVVADVLSIESALSIVAKRARLMTQMCALNRTSMLAVALGDSQMRKVLSWHGPFPDVVVACVNTESACVVAGPLDQLHRLSGYLSSAQGVRCHTLDVPLGFHSPSMDPILNGLTEHAALFPIHPPSIPIASNVLGMVVLPGDGSVFCPSYFAEHCRQPVLFLEALRSLDHHLNRTPVDAWIEIGPHPSCLSMIESTLTLPDHSILLPSSRKETNQWHTMSGSLACLYKTNLRVDWRNVFAEITPVCCVDLPSYPFEVQKFWIPLRDQRFSAPRTLKLTAAHPMLSDWLQHPTHHNGNVAIFDTPIEVLAPYIEGHRVGGHALCPAAVYLEQVLAAANLALHQTHFDFGRCMPILREARFSRPLVYCIEVDRVLRTYITIHEDGTGAFRVTSRLNSSQEESLHVHGDIRFSSTRETACSLALELPEVKHRLKGVTGAHSSRRSETFSMRSMYEVVFPRVVEYSEEYHTVQSLVVGGDGLAGIAQMTLQTCNTSCDLAAQPLFIDTMLHVAGFMANMRGDVSDAFICNEIGCTKILRHAVDSKQSYTIYCMLSTVASEGLVSADIFAVQESNVQQPVIAHLKGVQFRGVRLASLTRGLSIAASTTSAKVRKRTDSNAIISPMSPRSVIFSRSRSSTQSNGRFASVGVPGLDTSLRCHTPSSVGLSPRTLVSDGSMADEGVLEMVEDRIRAVMSKVLGLADDKEIKDDADFRSLGLDSLSSIEAQQALKLTLDVNVPQDLFLNCPTFLSLCRFLTTKIARPVLASEAEDASKVQDAPPEARGSLVEATVVSIQESSEHSRAPLILIHDGSGLVSYYDHLSPLGRAVWGLSDPRLFAAESWESLEEMASAYARIIQKHVTGAVILGGWSFGGVVAFEVAKILIASGVSVKGVLLIDSPAPSTRVELPEAIIDYFTEVKAFSSMHSVIKREFRRLSRLLHAFLPGQRSFGIPLAFLRSEEGFSSDGIENVPDWFGRRDDVQATVGPWKALSEAIEVWDIPGHHFEPFSPARVQHTSEKMDRACCYLESLEISSA